MRLMPVHQYIPNSDPEIKKSMLTVIGVKDPEELFQAIPSKILFNKNLNLPHAAPEYQVRRHIEQLLSKNKDSTELLSF